MTQANNRPPGTISAGAFVLALIAVLIPLIAWQMVLNRNAPQPPAILITEFCAHNASGIKDQDGDRSDWIELYNAGTNAVDLEGWCLTDNFHVPAKWRFPAVTLAPDKYLVVFASKKDRHSPGAELHTNFKLNEEGEYLGLALPDGQTVVQDFFPKYPRQRMDISYGLTVEATRSQGAFKAAPQSHRYFRIPTPGRANEAELVGLVNEVRFNHAGGFYESAFKLSLSTATRGATIYFTTNGSTPSPTNGSVFSHPIRITTTTTLRALAVAPRMAASELTGRTCLFPADVLRQTGGHLPDTWGKQDDWTAPAHYTMAAELVNQPAWDARLVAGLLSLPTISIVTDPGNLFDPDTGIYTHPMSNGVAWERPASVEMIDPAHGELFQINCGLRIQGGWGRRPEESPKHSFRLLFKKDYGRSKLQFPLFGTNGPVEFQTVILRAGNNNSWLHWNSEERRQADYLRDEWMRESMSAMGHPTARGRFVQLYLNGLYWGLYNLCERPDASFAAAREGGSRKDYDSMKAQKALSGNKIVWNTLMQLVNSGLQTDASYQAFQNQVDLPEFTDYLILNFYGANADWDSASNWYAARRRAPGGKYQFLVWDGERTLEGVEADSMDFDDDESPPRLFHKLSENAEFRLYFADRVQKLMFNDGPLAPGPAAQRYAALAAQIEKAVAPESARWGNYRRDLHPYKVGPYEFYQPDEHWRPEVNRLLSQYFPERPGALLRQFRERGLYPRINPPLGQFEHSRLRLRAKEGAIYYTTNAADPRLPADKASPQAVRYTQPIAPAPALKIKARAAGVSTGALEWSALVEY